MTACTNAEYLKIRQHHNIFEMTSKAACCTVPLLLLSFSFTHFLLSASLFSFSLSAPADEFVCVCYAGSVGVLV